VVENATLPETRRIALTLAELPCIAQYGITGPVVIMLGSVFAAASTASAEPATPAACRTA
ncbi:MAG TPA: hypothetical protein VKF40_25810, partial [Burkholderiales bacterium]|nr:hypothetical protein [Burkholderiales bacterium]